MAPPDVGGYNRGPVTTTDLILAGNGPGELRGWIAPVAESARQLAAARGINLRLTLALSPSQFAGGGEPEVVARWGLFDRILPPSYVTRLAVGLERVEEVPRGALIHLGGELSISARIARRLRIPACALAETTLLAARHHHFVHIFAVTEQVAGSLAERGVPRSKISVSGDPRSDALPARPSPLRDTAAGNRAYQVSFLPGSRPRLFTALVPYFSDVASALGRLGLPASSQVIVSEFLPPRLVDDTRRRVSRRWPDLPLTWVTHDPWDTITQSDLTVTIPGTNTLELAMLTVPFAVVVEERLLHLVPLEGAAEWLTRGPIGAMARRALLRRTIRRIRFVALPNIRAQRMVVPEWIGRWAPEDLAKRVAGLLRDRPERDRIRADLERLRLRTPGAAARIVGGAFALAEGTIT